MREIIRFMTKNPQNGNKPDSLKDTLAKTVESLERSRAYHSEKAAQYGVARDVFVGFQKLSQTVPEETLAPFEAGFRKFRLFAEAKEKQQIRFDPSSNAIALIGTSTAIACGGMTLTEVAEFVDLYIQPPAFWSPERSRQYAARLEKLDAELGRLFRGVNEVFWGSVENPERAAMALARQCFDHLFSVLAPDDAQIRASEFFHPKEGDKPLAVSRVERVKYAAATRVKDKAQADLLIEQAAEMVEAYEDLQKLHARQSLDRSRVRPILQTFIAAVEQWIDALEL